MAEEKPVPAQTTRSTDQEQKATTPADKNVLQIRTSILQNVLSAFNKRPISKNDVALSSHDNMQNDIRTSISSHGTSDTFLGNPSSHTPSFSSTSCISSANRDSQPSDLVHSLNTSYPNFGPATKQQEYFDANRSGCKKTQNVLEQSEKSAFTYVSPTKENTMHNLNTTVTSINVMSPSSLRLKPRFSLPANCTVTQIHSTPLIYTPAVPTTTLAKGGNHVRTNSSVPCKFQERKQVKYNNDTSPLKHEVSTETQVSLDNCSQKEVSQIDYLPTIHEESFNSSALTVDVSAQTTLDGNAAGTSITQTSENNPTSQTFLLAVPECINVNQFSNQTLNLDYNSQQILKALLHNSMNANTSGQPHDKKSNIESQVDSDVPPLKGMFSSLLEDSNEEDKNNTANVQGNETHKNISMVTDFNRSDDHEKLQNIPVTLNRSIDQHVETQTSKQNDIGCHKKTSESQVNEADLHVPASGSCNPQTENPLPVAAINVNMINGQPVYTIQLMGQSIPLAAITIPTADGPLQLQSAALTTSLPPQQDEKSFTAQQTNLNAVSCQELKEKDVIASSSGASTITSQKDTAETSKSKYTCEICGKSYVRSWSYYGHLREHAGDNEKQHHKCYVCSRVFSTVNGLKQHLQVHVGEKEFLCTICNKTFDSTMSLRSHQLSHANEKLFVCKAASCGKSFTNATSLRIHQRVHQEEKPYACAHPGCGKSFKTPSELSRHEFRHTGEKPFKCDQCEKSFVRNDDLKRHYFTHTGQKRFKCDQCDFSCIQSFDLVKHKYIHGGEKPFKCSMCPKQFTRPARLREHQRLHTGERPYSCEDCGKSFSQLTSLKSHKLTHGGQKPFKCDHCDRAFATATDLRAHVNTHMGVKPFQCEICNKDFVSSKTLKRHAVVHTGEKPHECDTCQRKFARVSDLKVHVLVHRDDKPFKCTEPQCTKMFTRQSTLKEHLRWHTGHYPYKCSYCDKEFNHRSHYNVHLRIHTGERPHKCHLCPKEFSRKASLRQHLCTHGLDSEVVTIDEENDSNLSDTSLVEGQMMQFESNLHLVKSVLNAAKRKREDDDEDNADEMLLPKRQMTDSHLNAYSGTLLSNLVRMDRSQLNQVDDAAVVNTSNINSPVILTQLPSGHFAHLPQTQILNSDGSSFVALNLSDIQDAEGIIQMHNLHGLQGLTPIVPQHHESMDPNVNQGEDFASGALQLDQISIGGSGNNLHDQAETMISDHLPTMEHTMGQIHESGQHT